MRLVRGTTCSALTEIVAGVMLLTGPIHDARFGVGRAGRRQQDEEREREAGRSEEEMERDGRARALSGMVVPRRVVPMLSVRRMPRTLVWRDRM